MSTIKKTWEIELVDDLIAAGNENATLSGDGDREKAMENLAYPIAKAIKNGGGNIHWVDLLSVSEINSIENPEKDGVYGIKDGGVIVNSDGSLLEVGTNDAVMWNGEKWTTFLHIDLTGYATDEELSSAIAAATTALSAAIASEASRRGVADESISKDLADHEGDKDNPHGVTPEQIGAAKSTDLAAYVKKTGDTMTGRLTVQTSGGDPAKAAEGAIVAKMTAAKNRSGVSTNGSVFAGDLDSTDSQFVGTRRKLFTGDKVAARFQIYASDATSTASQGTAAFMQVDYTSTATIKSIFEFGHNYGTKEDNWGTMTFGGVTKNIAYKEDFDTVLNTTSTSAPQTKVVKAAIDSHTTNTSNPHNVTAEQVGAYTKEQVDDFIRNWSGYVVIPYGQQKPDAKDAELGKIYLVQISNDPTVNDKFEEWISDGSAWSLIGERSVNLEGYVNGIKSDTTETFGDESTIVVRKDGSNILTRTALKLWNYIKVKADAVYSAIGHKHGAGDITSGTLGDDRIASASTWNGKYSKPSGGIPKGDLAQSVQTSLGKADTALQASAISDMETKTHASSTYQPKGDYLTTETDPTVPAWAKAESKPSYTASEVGAATASHTHKVKINGSEKTINPSSGSVVDLGTYLTSHQDISGKENSSNKVKAWSATTTDAHYPSEKLVKTALDGKSNTGHNHDDLYYTESEIDTKLGNKVDKVSGKGLSANDFTTTLKNKLDGIASGAEVNVQSDWNQTDSSKDDYIKNKPASMPPTAHNHSGSDITSKVDAATTADKLATLQAGYGNVVVQNGASTLASDVFRTYSDESNGNLLIVGRSDLARKSRVRLVQNGFTSHLGPTTITADRDWSLPNANGTLALTSDILPFSRYTSAKGSSFLVQVARFTATSANANFSAAINVVTGCMTSGGRVEKYTIFAEGRRGSSTSNFNAFCSVSALKLGWSNASYPNTEHLYYYNEYKDGKAILNIYVQLKSYCTIEVIEDGKLSENNGVTCEFPMSIISAIPEGTLEANRHGIAGNSIVHNSGDETIAGVKTFSSTIQGNAATATTAKDYSASGTIASQFQSIYGILPSYTLPSSATQVAPVYQYGKDENTGLGVVTTSTLGSSSVPLNAQGGLNLKKSVLAVKFGGVETTTQWFIDINNNGTNANTIYLS